MSIPSTGIKDPAPFVGDGWLRDYMEICSQNTYPYSYHLLSGLFALGGIIGRRAAVDRASFTLYPSLSIILLGTSGIGKSASIKLAARVVKHAATINHIPYMRSHVWISLTPRGMMNAWQAIQRDHAGAPIEGIEVIDEMTGALKSRKGNEIVNEWIIGALSHTEVKDITAARGEAIVEDFTVGFGFCGVMETLRETLDESSFTGGFMHRFVMAYELDSDDRRAKVINDDDLKDLAAKALKIRAAAPPFLTLSEGADQTAKAIYSSTRGRSLERHSLNGFWNRVSEVCIKLAMLFAVSESRWVIEERDIKLADKFIRGHLYPGLAATATQLGASPQMRRLYGVHENLLAARTKGLPLAQVLMDIGYNSKRQCETTLNFMEDLLLAHVDWSFHGNGASKGRVWASKQFSVRCKAEQLLQK